MISFKMLTKEKINELLPLFEFDREDIELTLRQLLENSDEDLYAAVCIDNGCLLVRMFDFGRYSFIHPVPINDSYNVEAAINNIMEYAIIEELTPKFTDVPREELAIFTSRFNHIKIDLTDADYDSFTVELKNECQMLDELPFLRDDGISEDIELSQITNDDIPIYAALCRNKELNKYWGYDYESDAKNASDKYFFDVADDEFRRGVAIILGIYENGVFVGEASIYGFDYMGGARAAVRVLPQYQRLGIATAALKLIKTFSQNIGISNITLECLLENKKSQALLSKVASFRSKQNGKLVFSLD